MVERVEGRAAVLVMATALALSACGRTTLGPAFEAEAEPAGSGSAGTKAGGDNGGSSGVGTAGFMGGGVAGSVSIGGTAGVGGVTISGAAGATEAGQPSVCLLAPKDCRREAEAECEPSNLLCRGELLQSAIYPAGAAWITSMTTAAEGSIIAAGGFQGTVDFGGSVAPLEATTEGDWDGRHGAAFVASFNSNGVVQWAHVLDGPGVQAPVQIDVTSSGLVIATLYGGTSDPLNPLSIAAVAADGVRWRYPVTGTISVTGVAIDDNDDIWISGAGTTLTYRDRVLQAPQGGSYLLRVDDDGAPIEAETIEGSTITALVVDNAGELVLGGVRKNASGDWQSFLERRSKSGEATFTKEWEVDSWRTEFRVAVDRARRITVARRFEGTFESEGETFESGKDSSDVWLAQYSPAGELSWQQTFQSVGRSAPGTWPRSYLTALVTDAFDNLLLLGTANRVVVGDQAAEPPEGEENLSYVLKLRADGQLVWLRGLYGDVMFGAITTELDGHHWLGGRALVGDSWYDANALDTAKAPGALLLRISP